MTECDFRPSTTNTAFDTSTQIEEAGDGTDGKESLLEETRNEAKKIRVRTNSVTTKRHTKEAKRRTKIA